MKMKSIFIWGVSFTLLLAVMGCEQSNTNEETQTPELPETAVIQKIAAEQPAAKAPPAPTDVTKKVADEWTFEGSHNGAKRNLTVQLATVTDLEFNLSVENESAGCSEEIEGRAILRGGDMEIRENPQGEAMMVQQFDYESKNCGLSILLDPKDPAGAWVEQWDCDAHEGDCAYGTDNQLTRI